MDDRDHFAAAALTGLIANGDYGMDFMPVLAYEFADAMLSEREQAAQKVAESDSFCAACPERDNTNHDAAPAAIANAESVAPQPTAGDRSGNPTSHSGTGNTSDRSQPVKDDVFDRSQPISDERLAALEELSALDQDLEARHGLQGNPMIKAQQRTPPQGSVQGEGSVPDSRNAKEPVAWWLRGTEYDTGCEYEYVSLVKESADAAAKEGGTVTPLYRAPTLTDEEREAVERAADLIDNKTCGDSSTLRGLLERLA